MSYSISQSQPRFVGAVQHPPIHSIVHTLLCKNRRKTRLQHQASELAGASQMCGQCGKRFYMLRNGLMEHVFCQEVGVAPMECTPAARFHGTTVRLSACLRTSAAAVHLPYFNTATALLHKQYSTMLSVAHNLQYPRSTGRFFQDLADRGSYGTMARAAANADHGSAPDHDILYCVRPAQAETGRHESILRASSRRSNCTDVCSVYHLAS